MSTFWNPLSERTAAWIRKGGPGNKWLLLDVDGSQVDAPTGGRAGVESRFGLDRYGNRAYLGSLKQGDPERFTATLMFRLEITRIIQQLRKDRCPFDLFVQQRCNDLDPLNYTAGYQLFDGSSTSVGFDQALQNLAENVQNDVMRTIDVSFSPIEEGLRKLKHLDISETTEDFQINQVISVGFPSCIGDCSITENDGEQDFWWVTNADSTPGYASIPAPKFGWTDDQMLTRNFSYIDVFPSGNATSVVKAGQYVVVTCPTIGVAYARFEDLQNGVANPWTLATGLTTEFPNKLFAASSQVIYGASDAGYIQKSTNSGITWTTLSAGTITAQNLSDVYFLDENLGYFAGANGALVQYFNGTLSLMPVRTTVGGAAITENINSVKIPDQRPNEVFLGTASGNIYRSQNALGSYPLFTSMPFFQNGTGSIDDLQFAGYKGDKLFIIQSNAAGYSQVLRDISGGALDNQVEIVGSYVSPSNNGINSIAPASTSLAITVGNVHETYAFIGKVLAS